MTMGTTPPATSLAEGKVPERDDGNECVLKRLALIPTSWELLEVVVFPLESPDTLGSTGRTFRGTPGMARRPALLLCTIVVALATGASAGRLRAQQWQTETDRAQRPTSPTIQLPGLPPASPSFELPPNTTVVPRT